MSGASGAFGGPDTRAGGFINTPAAPDEFGAQIGRAMEGFGQSAEQSSNTLGDVAMRQQDTLNKVATDDQVNWYLHETNKLQFGDAANPQQPGFYSLRGTAATQAAPAVQDQMEALRQQALSRLTAPAARIQFDQDSRRIQSYAMGNIGRHYADQVGVAANEADGANIHHSLDSAVLNANDEAGFQTFLGDARNASIGRDQRNGVDPATAQWNAAQITSLAWEKRVEAIAQRDPLAALSMYQANQSQFTAAGQMATMQRLKPQVDVQGVQAQRDAIISGAQSNVARTITQESTDQNVPPVQALTVAHLESNLGATPDQAGNPHTGLFQLGPAEYAANGGKPGMQGDVGEQARTGVANIARSGQIAQDALGRAPEAWETYIVHQQGAAGGPALLKADPATPAVDALAPAYGGNKTAATAALVSNGGNAAMTAGQFLDLWKGRYTAAESGVVVPDLSKPPDLRPDATAMLARTDEALDPFGDVSPQFRAQLRDAVKAKLGEAEYGQAQADRADKQSLMAAALGAPVQFGGGQPGQPSPTGIAANRPTSLDELMLVPGAKDAWIRTDPQTQNAISGILEQNARHAEPQFTQEAFAKYYTLQGESITDREAFQKENIADPALVGMMPHNLLLGLAAEQHRNDAQLLVQQQRNLRVSTAVEAMKPDLLAAGIRIPTDKDAGTPVATTYAQFVGRMGGALEKFRADNQRAPNDQEVRKLGTDLLMQGTQPGTGWFSDNKVRAFQVGPDQFAGPIPDKDRAGIVTAFKAQNAGAMPTETQVQKIFRLKQGGATAPPRGRIGPVDRHDAVSAPPAAPAPAPDETVAFQAGP